MGQPLVQKPQRVRRTPLGLPLPWGERVGVRGRWSVVFSARVQAQYLPADKEVQIVSRTVAEMRVTVAPQWLPATLVWNGLALENLKEAGCYLLSVEKALLHARPCK